MHHGELVSNEGVIYRLSGLEIGPKAFANLSHSQIMGISTISKGLPGSSRSTLIGTEPARTLVILGLAILLSLVVFLIGGVARQQQWITEVLFQVVLLVVIGGLVVAAGNARWNDGLLLSWLLIAGPVIAWVWQHELVVCCKPLQDILMKAGGFGVLAALVIGTPGYAVGRGLSERIASDERTWVPSDQATRWILGEDEQHVRRGGRLTGVFFLGLLVIYVWGIPRNLPVLETIGVTGPLLPIEYFLPVLAIRTHPIVGVGITVVWIGIAAIPAYRGYGLYISWLLVFGLVMFPVTEGVAGTGSVLLAILAAIITGTVGYVVGRLVSR